MQVITANDTIHVSGKDFYQVVSAGGAYTADKNEPVQNGVSPGQQIIIEGTDDTNSVAIPINGDSNVRSESSDNHRRLGLRDILGLVWDGKVWLETFYSNCK